VPPDEPPLDSDELLEDELPPLLELEAPPDEPALDEEDVLEDLPPEPPELEEELLELDPPDDPPLLEDEEPDVPPLSPEPEELAQGPAPEVRATRRAKGQRRRRWRGREERPMRVLLSRMKEA
jgi:hypothetical protein